jgi:hypothetical protein
VVILICEDLAQNDEVADLTRAVGPTGIVTPLLDGPQLTSRWSARYASVFADDPGSAVLTVSAWGLVDRCRPRGRDAARVVGLWKDPRNGFNEIPLESGAQGILLTACVSPAQRHSNDGRRPVQNAVDFYAVGLHQIRPAATGSQDGAPVRPLSDPPPLNVDDLTILCGWAEAVAEALAGAAEPRRPGGAGLSHRRAARSGSHTGPRRDPTLDRRRSPRVSGGQPRNLNTAFARLVALAGVRVSDSTICGTRARRCCCHGVSRLGP